MTETKSIGFIDIPKDWDFTSLGDEEKQPLKKVMNGYAAKQDKSTGEFKVSRIETISNGFIDESKIQYLSNVSPDIIDKYLIRKGDILFSHINSDKHLGKTGLATRNYSDLLHGMNLLLFRVNQEVISSEFLNYVFNFYRQIGVFIRICSRAVNQSSINQSKLKALQIPLPSPDEQQKISFILSQIEKAIKKQDEILFSTTELKNALMQNLFTEGTKNEKKKETEIGLVPKSWQVEPLNKTGDVIYGIQAAVANNTKPVGIKILTNVNIDLEGNIVLEKVRYYKLKSKRDFNTILQQGDILFNWRSGSKEHVGKTAIFDLEGEYTHSSFILRIRPNKEVDSYFLFLYLFYLRATGYFVKQQTYSINAKFNKSAIDVLPVTLPLPDEQKTIAKTIRAINKKIEHHETKKQTLTELFNAMLHKLMTGEVRVKDLDLRKEYSSEEESLRMAAES